MIKVFEYTFAVVLLPVLGFAWLAMVQRKPQEAVFGRCSRLRPRQLRLLSSGYGCLTVSAVILVERAGLEFAILLWPLSLSLGAISISMLLTYLPQSLRHLMRPFMTSCSDDGGR